jgi:hypothetical protein
MSTALKAKPKAVSKTAAVSTGEPVQVVKKAVISDEAKAAKAAEKAAAKEAAAAVKAAEKAAKAAEKAASKPVKIKVELEVRNGEKRPKAGTTGGRIWASIDALAANLGAPPTNKQVFEAESVTANELPINVQSIFARWRRFNGLSAKREVVVASSEVDPSTEQ